MYVPVYTTIATLSRLDPFVPVSMEFTTANAPRLLVVPLFARFSPFSHFRIHGIS